MATFNDNYSQNASVLGTLGDARDGKNILLAIPFYVVVPASPGTGPTFNLGVTIPAGFKPMMLFVSTNGISASATVNATVTFGDAGDASRLASAQDLDVTGASFVNLDPKAFDYEYLADTQMTCTVLAGKTPVTGQKIFGMLMGRSRKAT